MACAPPPGPTWIAAACRCGSQCGVCGGLATVARALHRPCLHSMGALQCQNLRHFYVLCWLCPIALCSVQQGVLREGAADMLCAVCASGRAGSVLHISGPCRSRCRVPVLRNTAPGAAAAAARPAGVAGPPAHAGRLPPRAPSCVLACARAPAPPCFVMARVWGHHPRCSRHHALLLPACLCPSSASSLRWRPRARPAPRAPGGAPGCAAASSAVLGLGLLCGPAL
jgi:hypothetical protein